MEIIKLNPYELGDLRRIFEYVRRKKLVDLKNNKITREMYDYDIEKIRVLEDRIDGKFKKDYLIRKDKNFL